MKNKLIILSSVLILLSAMAFRGRAGKALMPEAAPVLSDTAAFTANLPGGWTLISGYLNQDTPDSVEFELTLRQSENINWHVKQYIGTIANPAYLPKDSLQVTYNLLSNSQWRIGINAAGQCFLQQLSGPALPASSLPGNPYILPVRLRYRND